MIPRSAPDLESLVIACEHPATAPAARTTLIDLQREDPAHAQETMDMLLLSASLRDAVTGSFAERVKRRLERRRRIRIIVRCGIAAAVAASIMLMGWPRWYAPKDSSESAYMVAVGDAVFTRDDRVMGRDGHLTLRQGDRFAVSSEHQLQLSHTTFVADFAGPSTGIIGEIGHTVLMLDHASMHARTVAMPAADMRLAAAGHDIRLQAGSSMELEISTPRARIIMTGGYAYLPADGGGITLAAGTGILLDGWSKREVRPADGVPYWQWDGRSTARTPTELAHGQRASCADPDGAHVLQLAAGYPTAGKWYALYIRPSAGMLLWKHRDDLAACLTYRRSGNRDAVMKIQVANTTQQRNYALYPPTATTAWQTARLALADLAPYGTDGARFHTGDRVDELMILADGPVEVLNLSIMPRITAVDTSDDRF